VVILVLEGDAKNGNANDTAIPVLIGSDVTIACDMTEAYIRNLVVSWVNIPQDNPRVSTREDSITRELFIIENIQRQDADDYICFAANNTSNVANRLLLKLCHYLADPYIITVESNKGNSLSISWTLNGTTNNPVPVINLFVAYTQVNGTSPETRIQKLAPSVSKTEIRGLPADVLYKVQVWSSNAFGNSTPSEEVCIVVIAGILILLHVICSLVHSVKYWMIIYLDDHYSFHSLYRKTLSFTSNFGMIFIVCDVWE